MAFRSRRRAAPIASSAALAAPPPPPPPAPAPPPPAPSADLRRELNALVLQHLAAEGAPIAEIEALAEALERGARLPVRHAWDGSAHPLPRPELLGPAPAGAPSRLSALAARLLRLQGAEAAGRAPITSLLDAALLSPPPPLVPGAARRGDEAYARRLMGVRRARLEAPPFLPWRFARHASVQGHRDAVYCSLWDRTGRRLVTGSDDGLVKIWATDTGTLVASLRGHEAEVSDMCISHDNALLATGSNDASVRLWSLEDGAPRGVLAGHTDAVSALAFAPPSCLYRDAPLLLSASLDGTVRMWAIASLDASAAPAPLRVFHLPPQAAPAPPVPPALLCASLSASAALLAAGASDGRVRLWPVRDSLAATATPAPTELAGHTGAVTCVAFARLSDALLSGSADGTSRLWLPDAAHPRGRRELVLHARATPPDAARPSSARKTRLTVTFVCWTAEDRHALTALSDGAIQVWSGAGELRRLLLGHERESYVLEGHPHDPDLVLSASYDGRACLWDVAAGALLREFALGEASAGAPPCLLDGHFAPDGLAFVLSDSAGLVHLYGTGPRGRLAAAPREQFFGADYAPLLRDAHNAVLDAATHLPPHLLPPGPLCNAALAPHAPPVALPSLSLAPPAPAELLAERLRAEARAAQAGPARAAPFAPPPRPRHVARGADSEAEAEAEAGASGSEEEEEEERESWSSGVLLDDDDEDDEGEAEDARGGRYADGSDSDSDGERRREGQRLRRPNAQRRRPSPERRRSSRARADQRSGASAEPEDGEAEGERGGAADEEGERESAERIAPPRWISGSVAERNTYVPQPGDEVVYLRAGHARFVAAAGLPAAHVLDAAYDEAPFRVARVEYVLVRASADARPLHVARLSLAPAPPPAPAAADAAADAATAVDEAAAVHVDFAQVGEADFLVLRAVYAAALARPLSRGTRVAVYYAGAGLAQGSVDAVGAEGGGQWESVVVRWDADGELGRVSPWEVEPPADAPPPLPLFPPAPARGALLTALASAAADPAAAPFRLAVRERDAPGYRSVVAAPVDLRLVQARLTRHWYRSAAALLADVRRIAGNCQLYNGADHPLAAQAAALVARLEPAIAAALAPPADAAAAAADANEHVTIDSPPPTLLIPLRLKRRRPRAEEASSDGGEADDADSDHYQRDEDDDDDDEPDDDDDDNTGRRRDRRAVAANGRQDRRPRRHSPRSVRAAPPRSPLALRRSARERRRGRSPSPDDAASSPVQARVRPTRAAAAAPPPAAPPAPPAPAPPSPAPPPPPQEAVPPPLAAAAGAERPTRPKRSRRVRDEEDDEVEIEAEAEAESESEADEGEEERSDGGETRRPARRSRRPPPRLSPPRRSPPRTLRVRLRVRRDGE